MAPQWFADGIVHFDQSILFTDPMVTDVCDIPLGKEKGGSHERYVQKGRWNPASPTHVLTSLAEAKCQLNQIFGKTTLEAI